MSHPNRIAARWGWLLLCVLAGVASSPGTLAQEYPTRPITIVVPFPPGGGSDLTTRLVGNEIAKGLGQRVVVENRPGAAGNIGYGAVARAAPDGYTLTTLTQNIVVNPHLYKEVPFDPLKDFQPVSLLVHAYSMLVVTPALPVRTMAELIAYGRSKPGSLTGGHGGVGGQAYMSMMLLASAAGFDIELVPYKGEAPVLLDLVGGRTSLTIQSLAGLGQHVQTGRLRPIAVTSPTRLPQYPEVPAIAETVAGFQAAGWWGIAAPARTPAAIVARLNQQVRAALDAPEVRKSLGDMGLVIVHNSPDEFAGFIRDEFRRYQKVVADAGIKPQ